MRLVGFWVPGLLFFGTEAVERDEAASMEICQLIKVDHVSK